MNDPITTTIPFETKDRDGDMADDAFALESSFTATDLVREKLIDAQYPGFLAEFDPIEGEAAGAFAEDAVTEEDALASAHDHLPFVPIASPLKP